MTANAVIAKTAPKACPTHGNRQAGMPRRWGDLYRYTCGCSTGIKRGSEPTS